MVINKIVLTSPEAVVEFSGKKIKPRHSSNPLNMCRYIPVFVSKVNCETFSPSS